MQVRPRVTIARFLISLSRFLQTLPVMVMRPKDLASFSRRNYASPHMVRMFSEPSCVDSGLSQDELELISMLPIPPARLLLLGAGGGREAIALTKKGFEVTALDFNPEQISALEANAKRHNVQIQGILQEISSLEVLPVPFDILWMSAIMYSCVPTTIKRRHMAERFAHALRLGGSFVCQFRLEPEQARNHKIEFLRRLFSWITLGNFWYENGDMIWGEREFIHAFSSEKQVIAEVIPAGFEAIYTHLLPNLNCGAIIFKKQQKSHS
jgi:hypothetical protein